MNLFSGFVKSQLMLLIYIALYASFRERYEFLNANVNKRKEEEEKEIQHFTKSKGAENVL